LASRHPIEWRQLLLCVSEKGEARLSEQKPEVAQVRGHRLELGLR